MAATRASLVSRWPKFASYDEDTVTAMLTLAVAVLDSSQWGDLFDQATELLACHFMQMEDLARHGAAGNLISRSKTTASTDGASESVTLSFAAGGISNIGKSVSEEALSQTAYGRIFVILRETQLDMIGVLSG